MTATTLQTTESHEAAAPDPAAMEYWRVERAARYLDVSRKRIYQLVAENKLEAIRLGPRTMRILRQSFERYLAELTAGGGEDSCGRDDCAS